MIRPHIASKFTSNMKKILGLILLTGAVPSAAQTAIDAVAGQWTHNGQTHAWVVGEMCAVQTVSADSVLLSQGFLQPAETTVNTGEWISSPLHLSIWPNPATDRTMLTGMCKEKAATLPWQMIDASGKIVLSGRLKVENDGSFRHEIALNTIPDGLFQIRILTALSFETLTLIKL